MSVIGPRPQLVRDMVFMTDEQRLRHTAKPGLSGLAQVNGRNAISWEDKLEWDLKYIRNISLAEDQFSSKHLDAIEGAEERAEYIGRKYKGLKKIVQATIISAANHCTLKMIQERCMNITYIRLLQKKYRKYVKSYIFGSTSLKNKLLTISAVINLKVVIRVGIILSENKRISSWIQGKFE